MKFKRVTDIKKGLVVQSSDGFDFEFKVDGDHASVTDVGTGKDGKVYLFPLKHGDTTVESIVFHPHEDGYFDIDFFTKDDVENLFNRMYHINDTRMDIVDNLVGLQSLYALSDEPCHG